MTRIRLGFPTVKTLFAFPNPVNEYSARLVAAGVVLLTLLYLGTGSGWVLAVIVWGFVARVLTGPTLSPLGQIVTRWITPWLESRLGRSGPRVPGPPKRFAQGIGATLAIVAVGLHLLGPSWAALAAVGAITFAATLESAFGICLGCIIFGWLMRIGLIPARACEACTNFSPGAA